MSQTKMYSLWIMLSLIVFGYGRRCQDELKDCSCQRGGGELYLSCASFPSLTKPSQESFLTRSIYINQDIEEHINYSLIVWPNLVQIYDVNNEKFSCGGGECTPLSSNGGKTSTSFTRIKLSTTSTPPSYSESKFFATSNMLSRQYDSPTTTPEGISPSAPTPLEEIVASTIQHTLPAENGSSLTTAAQQPLNSKMTNFSTLLLQEQTYPPTPFKQDELSGLTREGKYNFYKIAFFCGLAIIMVLIIFIIIVVTTLIIRCKRVTRNYEIAQEMVNVEL